MPGEDFDAALKGAIAFKAQGIGTLFTRLGENVKDLSEATAVVEHYESVLAKMASSGLQAEISVKPTQLGLDIDAETTYANLERLARAAAKAQSFLWVDMEGTAYTQPTGWAACRSTRRRSRSPASPLAPSWPTSSMWRIPPR